MNAEAINRVTVLGLGTMGHGIAQTFAVCGLAVRCFDESERARRSLTDRVEANLEQFHQAGLIDRDAIDPAIERLEISDSEADAVDNAPFVVEAVREDLEIKQELFARVETHVSPACVIASNTSTFPMTEMAIRLKHPGRAVNTHWFNPPHICPLVEVVPGARTSKETVEVTIDLLERAGKMPVRVNQELPGFLVNRIQVAMMREVLDLVDRGVASLEDIDRAVRGSMGLRLAAVGPLAVWDFSGLDVSARVYEHLVQQIRSDQALPDRAKKLVDAGHFGFKTGRGFFEHPPQSNVEELAHRDMRYLTLLKLFYGERAESE